MSKNAVGHDSKTSDHKGVKRANAQHQTGVRSMTRDRKTAVKKLNRISKAGAP